MNIAYLFDFDGTLVDSMPPFVSAMLRILDENGISYGSDIIKIITPLGLNGTAEHYIDQMGIKLSKEQVCRYAVYDESSEDYVEQMKAANDYYIYDFQELLHLETGKKA